MATFPDRKRLIVEVGVCDAKDVVRPRADVDGIVGLAFVLDAEWTFVCFAQRGRTKRVRRDSKGTLPEGYAALV